MSVELIRQPKVSISANDATLTSFYNPQVQVSYQYGINTRLVIPTPVGSGTITESGGVGVISTGTSSSSSATVETLDIVRAQEGQGRQCRFTVLYTTGVTGSKQLCGLGDSEDGFFIGFIDDVFGLIQRESSTDSMIAEVSTWSNKVFSGFDPTKFNVYTLQLGAGFVRVYMADPDRCETRLVHVQKFQNIVVDPIQLFPADPVRAEVENISNTTDLSMSIFSMVGGIEGVINETLDPLNSVDAMGVAVGTGALTPILSIRNKTTFNARTNKVYLRLFFLTFGLGSGNRSVFFEVIENPVLGGESFADVDTANSPAEFDISAISLSGGVVITEKLVNPDETGDLDLTTLNALVRPGGIITIAGEQTTGGGGVTADAALLWRELL